MLIGAFYTFGESLAFIAQPVLLGVFITWLEDHAGRTDMESYGVGVGLAFALIATSFYQAVVHHLLYFQTMRLGWNVRTGFTGLVHDKLLKVSGSTLQRIGSGTE